MKTIFAMASICEAPIPTYKEGVSAWVTHMARTHPVVAAPQLAHFGLLVPANNKLPGLRCFERFLCKTFTDVRFELEQKVRSPGFTIQAARIDHLGCRFVTRRHCGDLTLLG